MEEVLNGIAWMLIWFVGIKFINLSPDGFLIFTTLCLIGAKEK